MVLEKRGIPLSILLYFVTCGIYSIYWMYKISDDLYVLNNQESKAGMDILLSIVTCGIYFIYLNYKWGKMLDQARRTYNLHPKDDSVLFVILSIFGLSIVNYCIIQSSLNEDISNALQTYHFN